MLKNNCECVSEFSIKLARQCDYEHFKKVLSRGKHPSFVGKETFRRSARNGGALFFVFKNEIIAVSLINPRLGSLLALNVIPEHRNHGLGATILNFLMPNFVRVIDYKVSWFKKQGFMEIGIPKQGQKYLTHIMVKEKLIKLVGNLKKCGW